MSDLRMEGINGAIVVVPRMIMKRVAAFAINYFIFLLVYVVIDFIFLFQFFKTNVYLVDNNAIFTFGHYMVAGGGVLMFIYWLALDVATGIDVGKKVVKIKILPDLTIKKAFFHSLLKCCCCVIWPVTLCIYLSAKRMPYDKWLGISVVENEL